MKPKHGEDKGQKHRGEIGNQKENEKILWKIVNLVNFLSEDWIIYMYISQNLNCVL